MDRAARQARDELLALRCQLGKPGAFADLVREMERPLLYYAAKLLGDEDHAFDVLQEVWVRAFRDIRRLQEPRALRTWLYRLAHGLVVDRLRRDACRERAEKAWAGPEEDVGDEPAFGPEDAAAIHRALDALDPRRRAVLVLYFLEDLPVAEVAAVLGCPEGTVKSRLHHARRALKEALLRGGYGTSGR